MTPRYSNGRIEDRGHGSGLIRSTSVRCSICGVSVGNTEKHRAWHRSQGDPVPNLGDGAIGSASAKARTAALRARARKLLQPSRAQRTEQLRQKARATLGADDWKVFFKARRRLNQLELERSRMGLECFGDPDGFRR
jgi:hypothetical protein